MKNTIFYFLFLVLIIPNFYGQTRPGNDTIKNQDTRLPEIQIYDGNVSIETITGLITIKKNEDPSLKFNLNVSKNISGSDVSSVGFRGGQVSNSQNNTYELAPNAIMSGEYGKSQSLRVDLVPLINGQISNKKIETTNIQIELPEDYVFIRANKSVSVNKNGDKTNLTLDLKNQYLTPLVVVFNTSGQGVSIEKNPSSKEIHEGDVTFTLKVTNVGLKKLKNILVEDNLDSEDFSRKNDDFTLFSGEVNDRRLVWEQTIESLDPGESVELKYTVHANYDIKYVSLNAAKATVDGVLVGVSNKVQLY